MMKIVLCLDDASAYCFNGRRQSKDVAMRRHLLRFMRERGEFLLMNEYTERSFLAEDGLFTEEETQRRLEAPAMPGGSYLRRAEEQDAWAFCETEDITPWLDKADQLLIYRWGRLYPSDLGLDRKALRAFRTVNRGAIKGNSHDRITWSLMERKTHAAG